MSAKSIFVVTGDSGEYSDHVTWNVRAFDRKEDAEAFAERLQTLVNRTESSLRNADTWDDEQKIMEEVRSIDKEARWYCGEGAEYKVDEIPFGPFEAMP